MKCEYYKQKLNDVLFKCPIEAGIEILVYNLFDDNIDFNKYSLVEINRLRKNRDSRLTTKAGISDIAVLSTDFIYRNEERGKVYAFIEVKSAGEHLHEDEQILGQKEHANHFIYTNGITWIYYYKTEEKWRINLSDSEKEYYTEQYGKKGFNINDDKFENLTNKIASIQWDK